MASKLRLFTAKKVFDKFGKDLNIIVDNKIVASIPEVKFAKPRIFHNSKISNINPFSRIEQLANATFRSKAVLDSACTICGEKNNMEIHHIRKIKESSRAIKQDYLTSMRSRMNRKQISICKNCHIKLHRGEPLNLTKNAT